MTPKEITTLAHHRLVPPWVMKLVLEAVAIERERCAQICDELVTHYDNHTIAPQQCAFEIRNMK